MIEPGEDPDGKDPDDENEAGVHVVKPSAYKMIEPRGATQLNAEMNAEMNVNAIKR